MALINTINTYNAYVATGPVQAMTNKEFVADAYAKLLNLKGAFNNAEGRIKYWTDKLEAGSVTKANFAQVFMNEATTSQGSLVSNTEFQYNKDVIAAVEAKDATNTSITAIEEASSKIPPVNPDYTKTFTLTEGRDNIKGNAANNLFDATAGQNNAGAISNAFATGDKLDGMGGSNKLQATIMKDYSIKDDGNAMGIRATTDNIQQVNFEAMGSTGFSESDAVVVQATKMANVEQYWSDFSDSNLKITDINLNGANLNITKDVTFGMKDTAHKAGLTALFDSQSLKKSGETKANSSLSIEIADVSTETPLTPLANVNMNLTFSLGGTVYTLENLKADGGTYAGLITAVQTALAAKGLGSLDVKANGDYTSVTVANNTVNLPFTATKLLITDPAGAVFSNVSFQQSAIAPVAGGFLVAGTALPLDPSTSSTMIESNLILDNAGRGSLGGEVVIGGQSDSNIGVEKINVTVDRASKIDSLKQSSGLGTNGNASKLKQIDIASKGANGSLTINKIDANLDLVNATGFAGADLKMGGTTASTAVSNLAQFNSAGTATNVTLNATYDGAGRASDKQAFTINTGSGNDAITASVVGTSTSGSTQASLTVNSTGGNNTVTLSSTNAEVNKATVTTGAGTDTVTGGATHLTANTGAGNDVIYAENTGAKAVLEITTAFASAPINATSAPKVAHVIDVAAGNLQFLAGKDLVVTLAVTQGNATKQTIGYESAVVKIAASKGTLTTKSDLDKAIVKAINEDKVLSKLAVASIDSNNKLTVKYLVDGAQPVAGITVNVSNPASLTVAANSSSAAMRQEFRDFTNDSTYTDTEIDNLFFGALSTGAVGGVNQASAAANLSGYTIAPAYLADTDTYTITIGTDVTVVYGNTDTNTTATDIASALIAKGYAVSDNGTGVVSIATDSTVTVVPTGGTVTTTASTTINVLGTASTTTGVNTVNGGTGDDVIVLSSTATIVDTVKFDAGNFGNDKIVHFTEGVAGDKLDFTAWMNNLVTPGASTSVESQVRLDTSAVIVATNGSATITANQATVVDFATMVTAGTFAGTTTFANMTDAQVLAALTGTVVGTNFTVANAADLVGTTQNSILMVASNTNAGEYKVYQVTSTTATTESFTAATLVGSVDFGDAAVALAGANFA